MASKVNFADWVKKENFGLLLLRFFLGLCLIVYSIYCFMRGFGAIESLGKRAVALGLPFGSTFWGILAAFSFMWTGLFVILGFYFRLATFVLFVIGLIGIGKDLSFGAFIMPPFSVLSFFTLLALCLMFIGPGKFSINK